MTAARTADAIAAASSLVLLVVLVAWPGIPLALVAAVWLVQLAALSVGWVRR